MKSTSWYLKIEYIWCNWEYTIWEIGRIKKSLLKWLRNFEGFKNNIALSYQIAVIKYAQNLCSDTREGITQGGFAKNKKKSLCEQREDRENRKRQHDEAMQNMRKKKKLKKKK